jgi:hypothetical protein
MVVMKANLLDSGDVFRVRGGRRAKEGAARGQRSAQKIDSESSRGSALTFNEGSASTLS